MKNKTWHFEDCVDYRRLNDVTENESYPVPGIDYTFDAMAVCSVFSTLDLRSGSWRVEMDPRDHEKTAFSTGDDLWQFQVMLFGLCNAPAMFQRLMN